MCARSSIDKLVEAVRYCREANLILPALCLMFIAVDTLGSLIRPRDKPAQDREDFLLWVEKFLLPGSELPCSALDLYGARCSLLHAYSASSRLAREGRAKKLCWAWGDTTTQQMQALADGSKDAGNLIAVHIDDLFESFFLGKRRFHEAIAANPALEALVEERATSILVGVTP